MPLWESVYDLVKNELIERREEGCDVSGFSERIEASRECKEDLLALYREMSALPVRPDYPYEEPDDLREILCKASGTVRGSGFRGSEADLYDKIYGAWLGRCAGCALGKPVEAHPFVAGGDGNDPVGRHLRVLQLYVAAILPDDTDDERGRRARRGEVPPCRAVASVDAGKPLRAVRLSGDANLPVHDAGDSRRRLGERIQERSDSVGRHLHLRDHPVLVELYGLRAYLANEL